MKNTIRCCISCILPCGALDVVRIVHANGRVEEISGTILAGDIMKAYPKHVLKKPSSASAEDDVPKIVVVPPDAELQKGKIYFLMPAPQEKSGGRTRKKRRDQSTHHQSNNGTKKESNNVSNTLSATKDLLVSDRYLSEILSEKVSSQRDRRRGRVGVWRPHLESISETPSEVL